MLGDRSQETNAAGQCSQTPVIQSMMKHTVEKVEMNVAMLTAGIEKRADVRLSASHETAVVNMDMKLHSAWTPRTSVPSSQRWRARPCQVLHVGSLAQEERPPELVSSSVCVTQLEHREHDYSQWCRP